MRCAPGCTSRVVPRPAVAAGRASRPRRRVARARPPDGDRDAVGGPLRDARGGPAGSRRPRRSSSPSPSSGGPSGAFGSRARCGAPSRRREGTTLRSRWRAWSAVRWAERSAFSTVWRSTGREPHSVSDALFAAQGSLRRAGGRLAAVGAGVLGDVHRGIDDAHDPAARRRRRRLVLRHGHGARSASAASVVRTSYPTRVAYDGSPHPRWWQIEDHRYDPGAVAPHRTQLAAMMMIVTSSTATTGSRRRCSVRPARSWPSRACRSRT